jgi:hypothetical protein
MSTLVSRKTPVTDCFNQRVAPELPPVNYIPQRGIRPFNGLSNLFDASMFTACACEILPIHFKSNVQSPLLEGWDATGRLVRDRWAEAIVLAGEPDLVDQDYLALDNELYLQANVHLVLRLDSKLIIANFYYLPANEFQEVKSNCARKKDIYQLSAGIFLLNADGGIIVYEDGHDYELFSVARSQRLFVAIQKKCRWMRDMLLLKTLPSCSHRTGRKKGKSNL